MAGPFVDAARRAVDRSRVNDILQDACVRNGARTCHLKLTDGRVRSFACPKRQTAPDGRSLVASAIAAATRAASPVARPLGPRRARRLCQANGSTLRHRKRRVPPCALSW